MAFSLFGRKRGQGGARARRNSSESLTDAEAPGAADAHRDFAREMAARIDRIESEMMEVPGGVGRVAPSRSRTADALPGDAEGVLISATGLPTEIEEAALLFAEARYQEASAALDPLLDRAPGTPGQRLAWEVRLDALRAAGDSQALANALRALAPAIATGIGEPDRTDAPARFDCALFGVLQGADASELECLAACAQRDGDAVVSIDCSRLDRIDFAAAGALLNEVIALARAGRRCVFDGPGAAVTALMTAIGIADVAEVRRRRIGFPHSQSGGDRS